MTTGMASLPSTIAGQAPRPQFGHMTAMGPAGGEAGINASSSQQNFTGLSATAKPGSSVGMGQPPMAGGMTQQRMQHPGMTGQQQQQQARAGMKRRRDGNDGPAR